MQPTAASMAASLSSSPASKKVNTPTILVTVGLNLKFVGHTRTKNYTRGGTTTESNDAEQDKYKVNALGVRVDITPKPLFISRKSAPTHDAKVADGEENKADKNAAESKSKPKEVTESQ